MISRLLLGASALGIMMPDSPLSASLLAQDTAYVFSCHAFSAELSEAELVARFGAANVIRGAVIGADDGPLDGTILFPEQPDLRVEIRWQDTVARARPAWIELEGRTSRWRTAEGITLGMSLRALERLNRRPFRLAGFQVLLGGRVLSWGAGAIREVAGGGCRRRIQLQPSEDPPPPFEVFRQVRSGREHSSGHPAMQALNPAVVGVMLSYERK